MNDSGSDAYSCFDATTHKLELRLRKHKKRISDHNRKRDVHVEQEIAPTYLLNIDMNDQQSDEEEQAPPIIAEIQSSVPKLTVSEAVMRMDLAEENGFVFRSAIHGGLNFVYRRRDGNIAWVDVDKK